MRRLSPSNVGPFQQPGGFRVQQMYPLTALAHVVPIYHITRQLRANVAWWATLMVCKSIIYRWGIDEPVRWPVRWQWVWSDLNITCLMVSLLCHVQHKRRVGVCSSSYNCMPRPSHRPYCPYCKMRLWEGKTYWGCSVTAIVERVLQKFEPASLSRRQDPSTFYTTTTYTHTTSWRQCTALPSNVNAPVYGLMDEDVLRLVRQRAHWLAGPLCAMMCQGMDQATDLPADVHVGTASTVRRYRAFVHRLGTCFVLLWCYILQSLAHGMIWKVLRYGVVDAKNGGI